VQKANQEVTARVHRNDGTRSLASHQPRTRMLSPALLTEGGERPLTKDMQSTQAGAADQVALITSRRWSEEKP
jgi:hypothetical protein